MMVEMRRWRETQIDGARANSDKERERDGLRQTKMGQPDLKWEPAEGEREERDTLMSLAVKCKSFCCT